MLFSFTFYIGNHHLVLYGQEQKAVNKKRILMQCIEAIGIKNTCSTTDKAGNGLFPESTNRNFWGHTCIVNQLYCIQPLISIEFAVSYVLLKMVFLFRMNRRNHSPFRIRHIVFAFQIPNDI